MKIRRRPEADDVQAVADRSENEAVRPRSATDSWLERTLDQKPTPRAWRSKRSRASALLTRGLEDEVW